MEAVLNRAGNAKAMARAKRAASQRSRARFSHTKRPPPTARSQDGAAAEASDSAGFAEERLPSNRDYYGELPLSDGDAEEAAFHVEHGQEINARVKSKGADYNNLLTQDVIPLYHDLPELGGLGSVMAANGLDFLVWDAMGLEESIKGQAASEAAALLSLDLKMLGKSLANLKLSQRLFLEDEVLATQVDIVERDMNGTKNSKSDLQATVDEDSGALLVAPRKPSVNIPEASLTCTPSTVDILPLPLSSGWAHPKAEIFFAVTAQQTSLPSSTFHAVDSLVSPNGSAFPSQAEWEEPKNAGEGSSHQSGMTKFEAQTAEAELDALLDMLDVPKPNLAVPSRPVLRESTLRTSEPVQSDMRFQESSSEGLLQQHPVKVQTWESKGSSEKSEDSKLSFGDSRKNVSILVESNTLYGESGKNVSIFPADDFDAWLDSV